MPQFQKPNLEADSGGFGRDPYVSVRSDEATLGLSRAARDRLGVSVGDYFHFAIDRTGDPWIGIVEEETDQGEPQLRKHGKDRSGVVINSTLLNRHLREIAGANGEPDSSLRFYFLEETAEDPDTGATLHKLEVPDVE